MGPSSHPMGSINSLGSFPTHQDPRIPRPHPPLRPDPFPRFPVHPTFPAARGKGAGKSQISVIFPFFHSPLPSFPVGPRSRNEGQFHGNSRVSVAAEGAPRTRILSGIGGKKKNLGMSSVCQEIPFSSQRLREFSWNVHVKSEGDPGAGNSRRE